MSDQKEAEADVLFMAEGFCYMSVCAAGHMDGPAVEAAVRRQRVSGTEAGWLRSEDPTFSGGQTNPCACDQVPGRLHWLFAC